jgi:hypothetical protein
VQIGKPGKAATGIGEKPAGFVLPADAEATIACEKRDA